MPHPPHARVTLALAVLMASMPGGIVPGTADAQARTRPATPTVPPPDRAPTASEWGYRPAEGATVSVSPPSLTWVHEAGARGYSVQIARDESFTAPITVRGHRWPAYTHSAPLAAGRYVWRYRIEGADGALSRWSRTRSFRVAPDAAAMPQPTLSEVRRRLPAGHPRLFVRPEQVEALRAHARGAGRVAFEEILRRADSLLVQGPTPEPTVMASLTRSEGREHWWPNAMQTTRAAREAELIAFAYLLSGEPRYGSAARRWILHVASFDPDGPTNWELNDEAGMPILQFLPVAYTWAYDALTVDDRSRVQEALLRRGREAWRGYQHREGVGHLNQPYNSHGNRSWFMLAGTAIALIDVAPEAEAWLDFALHKFFAAYPVWSDADGGWHEGTSYLAGYMSGVTWWLELAERTLGIQGVRKPYFSRMGDFFLYMAPPGSPNLGFGDLSFGPPRREWSFLHYYARKARNPHWAWWAERAGIGSTPGDPVSAFLWSSLPEIAPRAPSGLPPSKVFRGTGLAALNHTLLDAADNVQVRLKSSPFGRRSHGHDPHNSFTVNAYGEALLVNNTYRDFYGSLFHTGWVWEARAQNALLVDGSGQPVGSVAPPGRIIASDLQDGADYVAGEAGGAYEGRLKRFTRHVVFVKPDVIVFADEIEAAGPRSLQWMLHSDGPFRIDSAANRAWIDRGRAGALVHLLPGVPVRFTQSTGYSPAPDTAYVRARRGPDIPPQWHLETATTGKHQRLFALTVVRPFRAGQAPDPGIVRTETASAVLLELSAPDGTPIRIALRKPGAVTGRIGGWHVSGFASASRGGRRWELGMREP